LDDGIIATSDDCWAAVGTQQERSLFGLEHTSGSQQPKVLAPQTFPFERSRWLYRTILFASL
jgi:hypothetical protein